MDEKLVWLWFYVGLMSAGAFALFLCLVSPSYHIELIGNSLFALGFTLTALLIGGKEKRENNDQ